MSLATYARYVGCYLHLGFPSVVVNAPSMGFVNVAWLAGSIVGI